MRKWLPGYLAIACFAVATPFAAPVAVFAGEEQIQQIEEGESGEEFSPYITLEEIENLTPSYAEADLKTDDPAVAARTEAADKEVEGKTEAEMTDDERSSANFIWTTLLVGKSFVLESLNSEPYRGQRPVTLRFDKDGNLSGRICNAFQAKPEFTGMMFKADNVATTRMACPDQELGKLEADFLRSLESGLSYFTMGENLELRRDNLVMIFRPHDGADAPRPAPGTQAVSAAPAPSTPTPAPAFAEPAPEVFAPVTPPQTAIAPPQPAAVSPIAPAPVAVSVAPVSPVAPAAPALSVSPVAPAPVAPPAEIVEVIDPSGPVSPIGDISEKDLAGRKFVLTHVDGETFTPDMGEQPYIQFDTGMRVSGKACNNFRGPATLQDDILTVENAASTMMMCVDPKLTQYESDLYRLLRTGMHMDLNGRELTLSGEGREFLYEEF